MTIIRSIGTNERFCWQKDDFWRVVDKGVESIEDENEDTIVSLLEMNPSHLPVIENAVARAAVVNDDANANAGLSSTSSAAPPPPPAILVLVLSALGFKLACLGKTAAELSGSGDFR